MKKKLVLTFALALTTFFSAAGTSAQTAYPNLQLAHQAIDNEDWNAAITYLTRAIETDEPKGNVLLQAGAYLYRCQAYFNKDKFELAVADCDRSIEIKANSASAYHLRAAVLSRLGKHERAIADYTYAIQLEPKEGGHYFSRGISYSRNGNSDQAIADFGKAIELDPNDHDALLLRAMEFRRKGDFDQALLDYLALAKVTPDSIEVQIGLGLSYWRKKDYDRAIASFNRALEIDPRSKDALVFRGGLYAEREEYELALKDLNEAVRLDPSFVSPYTIRGEALVKKGDYRGAISDFTKGIERGAGNSALYSRTWANLYANDGKATFADAQKFIALEKDSRQRPYAAIAGYLGLRKEKKDAEAADFARAELQSGDRMAWSSQVIRFLLGELPEKQFLLLANDNDKMTEARTYIGMTKIFTGDLSSARAHFDWVKANGNKSFTEYTLAIAELSRDQTPRQ